MASYGEVDAWSRRHEQRSQMTTACLWNACLAMGFGLLLVTAGATMAALGYYNQQPVPSAAFAPPAADSTLSVRQRPDSTVGGPYRHLSYFGSVIMGIGGFIVVASCVMTFEVRDSASKIVPARFRSQPDTVTSSVSLAQRSSASQTLPWFLQLAAAVPLSRSVSAPCVRGPLPPLRPPPPSEQQQAPASPEQQQAPAPPHAGHRKASPSGSGAPRSRRTASVGRLLRKHSKTVLCGLRASGAETRAPPPTSSGDQMSYDNRLGRQGGNNATSLVDGGAMNGVQRCSPNGGYHAFNGHRPSANNSKIPAVAIKRCRSSDRRISESVPKTVDARARRRDVLVHIEHGSGDETLTVSHVAPVHAVSVTKESEQSPVTLRQRAELLVQNRHAPRSQSHDTGVLASLTESAADSIVTGGTEPARTRVDVSELRIGVGRSSEGLRNSAACVPPVADFPATKVASSTAGITARVPPMHAERGCSSSPCSARYALHCASRLSPVPGASVVAVSLEGDEADRQSRVGPRERCCPESDSRQCDLGKSGSRQCDLGESGSRQCDLGEADSRQDALGESGSRQCDLGEADSRQDALGEADSRQDALGESGSRQCDLGESGRQQDDLGESGSRQCDLGESGSRQCDLGEADSRQDDLGESCRQQDDLGESGSRQCDLGESGSRQCDLGEAGSQQCDLGESGSPVDSLMSSENAVCPVGGPEMGQGERDSDNLISPARSDAASGSVQRQDSVPRLCPEPLQASTN